jgi:uncharacterized membrane protein
MLFSTSVDIQAPPERVWPVIKDVERWHEWTASIASITRKDDGPFGVGSSALVRQPKLPDAVWTVTSLDEGRQFTWETRVPGMHSIGRHAVEPAPGGSRATLSIELTGLLAPIIGRIYRRLTEEYIALEAAGLKKRSE